MSITSLKKLQNAINHSWHSMPYQYDFIIVFIFLVHAIEICGLFPFWLLWVISRWSIYFNRSIWIRKWDIGLEFFMWSTKIHLNCPKRTIWVRGYAGMHYWATPLLSSNPHNIHHKNRYWSSSRWLCFNIFTWLITVCISGECSNWISPFARFITELVIRWKPIML